MLVIGLVGGIGSGKSVATAMLAELGAEIVNADLVGHEVYEPGKPGFDAIVAEFGDEVVGADGRIDRKRLGAIVFADEHQARAPERHRPSADPGRDRASHRARAGQGRGAGGRGRGGDPARGRLAVAGRPGLGDLRTARGRAWQRLATQRGMAVDETDARIAKQMTDAERRSAADVVIENTGSLDQLRARLEGLWQTLVPR